MRDLEVAHITRRFVLSDWGGIETAVVNLCDQMRSFAVNSEVFATKMLSGEAQELIQGLPVRRFGYVFPWLFLSAEEKKAMCYKGGSPLSLPMLYSLIRRPNLSLIHTHVQHRLGGVARTAAKLRGLPYVVTIHGGYFTIPLSQAEEMQKPFSGRLEWGKAFGMLLGSRKTLQDADAIICIGRDEYEVMKRQYPNGVVHHVPNGVPVDDFKDAKPDLFREHYQIPADEKIVLSVSRFDYQKNQLLLIRSFAKHLKQFPQSRLVMIGAVTVKNYYDQLVREVKSLNLQDKVLFIPGISPGDPMLPSAYQAADCFVLSSSTEPFGIVILEAWAAGTPVIASRVGGIPGFTKDGEDVLLFSDQDEDELTDRMKKVFSSQSLSRHLVSQGSESVKSYGWGKIAKKTRSVYDEAIERKKGSDRWSR